MDDKNAIDTNNLAAQDIVWIELYLMFSTDMDFHVDIDGLNTFIRGHLHPNNKMFEFRADNVPIGDYEANQLIRLEVSLPWEMRKIKDGQWTSSLMCRRSAWPEEAIKQILLPAYMWIFAEIGIANHHWLSTYFDTTPFDIMNDGENRIWLWEKSTFTDGVRLTPRCKFMAGNYRDGWAQWRFILNDAKDYEDSKNYIESIKAELREYYFCTDDCPFYRIVEGEGTCKPRCTNPFGKCEEVKRAEQND